MVVNKTINLSSDFLYKYTIPIKNKIETAIIRIVFVLMLKAYAN